MVVTVISRSESAMEDCDYRDAMQIDVDDVLMFEVSDGEPEDSNLSRDFSDVYEIPKLMQMAYEAGRKGEDFEIKYEDSDDI